jgi:hypothetical protein
MYGRLPPKPAAVSAQIERVDASAFDSKATLSEVTLRFGSPEVPPIHLMLVVPNQRTAPAPVILGLNYFGNHTLVRDPKVRLADNWMPERGAGVVNNRSAEASRGTWADIWRIEDVIDRGYALATFYNGDIDPDTPALRGLPRFFPEPDPADECGTVGAWAWGLQRAVDYLVTAPGIDPKRIAVTGHSRLGKAALVAAAFDERIALAIPHQAGCGGTGPSRSKNPKAESVKRINTSFPHWFDDHFKKFNDEVEKIPFDQHCLLAICAPRPVLYTNGIEDQWANPDGQFEMLKAATPVYKLYGKEGMTATEVPPVGKLLDGTLGYYVRTGPHVSDPDYWKTFLDYADRHFKK